MKIQIALLAAALLAGCAQDSGNAESDVAATPASSTAATAPAQPSPSAADMDMSEADHQKMAGSTAGQGASQATGVGVVKSIDSANGKVTIAHDPIESLKWPAMTMAFNASPDLLSAVKEGDKVQFEFSQNAGTSTLSTLVKQD